MTLFAFFYYAPLIFANSCCGFLLQGVLFTLSEQSQCVWSGSFPRLVWISCCPEHCVNLFLGILAVALDAFVLFCFVSFCFLQSCKCPKGVDKDLRFYVTTVREFCLCSLFLHSLEITDDSTTIGDSVPCLMKKQEVSFGLGLALPSG